ncbi:hypothetical protein BKA61DRAFT_597799, partial [Leptodontidium sp. MPI-SDFR-AT-0119]
MGGQSGESTQPIRDLRTIFDGHNKDQKGRCRRDSHHIDGRTVRTPAAFASEFQLFRVTAQADLTCLQRTPLLSLDASPRSLLSHTPLANGVSFVKPPLRKWKQLHLPRLDRKCGENRWSSAEASILQGAPTVRPIQHRGIEGLIFLLRGQDPKTREGLQRDARSRLAKLEGVFVLTLCLASGPGNKKGGKIQSGIWNGLQAHRLVALIAVLAGCAIVVKTLLQVVGGSLATLKFLLHYVLSGFRDDKWLCAWSSGSERLTGVGVSRHPVRKATGRTAE